jgi:hypothetical protein
MSRSIAALAALLSMTACATCREHPVACGAVTAIAVGSIAASIVHSHEHARPASSPVYVGPPCYPQPGTAPEPCL